MAQDRRYRKPHQQPGHLPKLAELLGDSRFQRQQRRLNMVGLEAGLDLLALRRRCQRRQLRRSPQSLELHATHMAHRTRS